MKRLLALAALAALLVTTQGSTASDLTTAASTVSEACPSECTLSDCDPSTCPLPCGGSECTLSRDTRHAGARTD